MMPLTAAETGPVHGMVIVVTRGCCGEPLASQAASITSPGLDTLAQLQLDVFWGQRHALDVAFGGGGGLGGGDGIRKPITPTLLAEKLFRSGRRDVRRK